MSNVNSDDPVQMESEDTSGSMGGSHRTEQHLDQPVKGRGGWSLGSSLLSFVLIAVPVAIVVVVLGRAIGVVGDSNIIWLYATVAALVIAAGVWFIIRMIGTTRSQNR